MLDSLLALFFALFGGGPRDQTYLPIQRVGAGCRDEPLCGCDGFIHIVQSHVAIRFVKVGERRVTRPAVLLDLVKGSNRSGVILRLKESCGTLKVLGRRGVLPIFKYLPG